LATCGFSVATYADRPVSNAPAAAAKLFEVLPGNGNGVRRAAPVPVDIWRRKADGRRPGEASEHTPRGASWGTCNDPQSA